jgi:hypothetical protein
MYFFLALALILIAFPSYANEKNAAVFVRQSSTFFSESVPLKDFEDDLKGGSEPVPGKHALTYNRLEVGFGWRNFELARFMREDYVFEYTPDTMNIIYWDKNKKRIPQGSYDVYLKAQHIKTEGWRAGYRISLPEDSHVRVSLNYMEAEDLLYGAIGGRVNVENGDISGGNLDLLYYYEEDYLLDRPNVRPADGKGYSFDVEAQINLQGGWRLDLNFYDLLGEIDWKNAPYTDAAIASTTTYYDSEGYAHRNPMMTAMEGYRKFTQKLPVFYQLSLAKDLYGPLGISYTREKYDSVEFNRLFLLCRLAGDFHLKAGYDFTMSATWIGLESNAVSLNLATDDWSLVDSNSLILRLAGRLTF